MLNAPSDEAEFGTHVHLKFAPDEGEEDVDEDDIAENTAEWGSLGFLFTPRCVVFFRSETSECLHEGVRVRGKGLAPTGGLYRTPALRGGELQYDGLSSCKGRSSCDWSNSPKSADPDTRYAKTSGSPRRTPHCAQRPHSGRGPDVPGKIGTVALSLVRPIRRSTITQLASPDVVYEGIF